MKLVKIDPSSYMKRFCRSVNMSSKRSYAFIGCRNYRKNVGRYCVIPKSKKSNKIKTLKLRELHMKKKAFKIQY